MSYFLFRCEHNHNSKLHTLRKVTILNIYHNYVIKFVKNVHIFTLAFHNCDKNHVCYI